MEVQVYKCTIDVDSRMFNVYVHVIHVIHVSTPRTVGCDDYGVNSYLPVVVVAISC